jgi:hypothetical protein
MNRLKKLLMYFLDKYPLKNIAIHARLGKQLYKGGVDLDGFQNVLTRPSTNCITTEISHLLQNFMKCKNAIRY